MAKNNIKVKLFAEYNGGANMLDTDYVELEVSDKQLALLLELEEKLNVQNESIMEPGDGVWMSVEH